MTRKDFGELLKRAITRLNVQKCQIRKRTRRRANRVCRAHRIRTQLRTLARITQQGVVATSQALASQARRADSSCRAAPLSTPLSPPPAVLGVVEPMMDGIGGELFMLYWDAKSGELSGLNASGYAPGALSPALLANAGMTAMPLAGIHAVTVPGAVDGWAQLHKHYGNLPWDRLFASAIAYAEQGFPVTEGVAELWSAPQSVADRLSSHAESSRVFLVDGNPPRQGDVFPNPDLAGAYRSLAAAGSRDFYEGEIAAAIHQNLPNRSAAP